MRLNDTTISKFAEDVNTLYHEQSFVFEYKQDNELVEVSGEVDNWFDIRNFNVQLIDEDGNRRNCELADYQRLFKMLVDKVREVYENWRDSWVEDYA